MKPTHFPVSFIKLVKAVPASVFGAAVLFGCIWLLGWPTPFVDDLFMIGAALNLTTGGDFSNPLITRQEFPSHYFFAQPPTHSYALAGWLKIFGISAGALTGFQITMYFLTAVATIAILRRHSAPRWLEWLVGLAVLFGLSGSGLRMEPLAIALAMMGFALTECCSNWFAVTFAFLLMFLGGSAAPRAVFLPAALSLLAAWRLARAGKTFHAGLRAALVCAAIALTITVLLVLWMIDFRLGEFLTTFRFHTHKRIEMDVSSWEVLLFLLHHVQPLTGWPLLVLPFLVLCFNILRRPFRFTELDGIAACALIPFVLMALTGTISIYTIWFPVLALLAGTASTMQRSSNGSRTLIAAAVTVLLVVANKGLWIYACGVASGNIKLDPGSRRAEALAMRSVPGHKVVVDSWIARYVFGYRLPPDCAAFEFCYPIGGSFVEGSLPKGDVYLVSPFDVQRLVEATNLRMPETPMWAPLGVRRWAYSEYPCRVFIIPAESCNGAKPIAGR